ncbi:MAG: hypothetical protein KDA66_06140 [Planctomycetaceae bacterium]|nr:hypothetical protein [Planctomycetaceae bacterium]
MTQSLMALLLVSTIRQQEALVLVEFDVTARQRVQGAAAAAGGKASRLVGKRVQTG